MATSDKTRIMIEMDVVAKINATHEAIHGTANEPGLIKRVRTLEDERVVQSTTKQVASSMLSGIIAGVMFIGSLVAYFGPARLAKAAELLEKTTTPVVGVKP